MVIIPPSPYRKRRVTTQKDGGSTPAAVGPILVAAEYSDQEPLTLRTVFDRAVDVSAFVYGQLWVYDGIFNLHGYKAMNPSFDGANSNLLWELSEQDGWTTSQLVMTATANTGIVAVDNGVMWTGVTALALPFP